MLCPVLLLAFVAATQGRAVNISNTWVLPEEGFPVFYRYFRDRISWYEADAVCQFHHANLVTVDTTAQYDAVRAYLKELDISSAVWVGLIRSNPDGEFTWTDYRGLSGDGYWSAAPDARAAPLCAAANPVADYRWEARACGGPTVASFICELPVPQWALGNQGCMVKALPALTVLYLPESAAVQLTADCGLAGTKQVQCTGNVKHEDLLRNLSCAEEDETSVSSVPSTSASLSTSSDTSIGDQDSTSEITTEELKTTTEQVEIMKEKITSSSPPPFKAEVKPQIKHDELNKFKGMYTQKNVYIELTHKNNMQSNDIPMLAKNENILTIEESEKLEDEKNMQHKLLHDELARHGNFETIFTQPADHFVPPLVMAKAKLSDDMTVLSLAEKHAQQLAEQRLAKHKLPESHVYSVITRSTTEEPSDLEIIEKPLVMTMQPTISKYTGKKDKTKLGLPKKYYDKYTDPKSKNIKSIETKLSRNEKPFENSKVPTQVDKELEPVTKNNSFEKEDDSSIDLTVMLKELGVDGSRVSRFSNLSNTVPKEPKIQLNVTLVNASFPVISRTVNNSTKNDSELEIKTPIAENRQVIEIKITGNDSESSSTKSIIEITTRVPEFKDKATTFSGGLKFTETQMTSVTYRNNVAELFTTDATTTLKSDSLTDIDRTTTHKETNETSAIAVSSTKKPKSGSYDFNSSLAITKHDTDSFETTSNYEHHKIQDNTEEYSTKASIEAAISNTSVTSEAETGKPDVDDSITTVDNLNITVHQEDDFVKVSNESSEFTDDFQSPLLSEASEPLRRPNRLRRPQQPPSHMKKFSPFRILG